jgi:deazaflavin-dependent oxidoreductase (nitroreductase family)
MRRYRLTRKRRALNSVVKTLVRVGLGPRSTYLLTVTGRASGLPRTTPVTLVETDAGRWLVAPYGAVGWVHNVRVADRITLRRGRRSEQATTTELSGAEAAPVLREYLIRVPVTRPYFDVTPRSSLGDIETEAESHPVFALRA